MRIRVVLCSLFIACSSLADIIGYNFVSNWPNPTIGGETVDGFSEWTDSVDEANAPGGTTVPNSTSDFAVTTPVNAPMVTVAWSSANMWDAGQESNPEQGLYRVYLDDGGGVTITISGLADWLAASGDPAYEVRLYRSTDNNGAGFSAVGIFEGVSTADPLLEMIPTVAPGDPSIGDGGFPTAVAGGGGARMFQDALGTFSADTITFNSVREADIGGFPVRGTIAGFMITSIPEPATGVLALLGLGLLARRRRRWDRYRNRSRSRQSSRSG
jgi:MYXO-CTERM domain-containing protein